MFGSDKWVSIILLTSYLNSTYIDTSVHQILYKKHCLWNSVHMFTKELVRMIILNINLIYIIHILIWPGKISLFKPSLMNGLYLGNLYSDNFPDLINLLQYLFKCLFLKKFPPDCDQCCAYDFYFEKYKSGNLIL